MMKKFCIVLLGLIVSASVCIAADDKTDVTAQYISNASFESDDITTLTPKTETADGLRGYIVTAPSGWTVSNSVGAVSLIVTADCFTDNNFGKVTTLADGSQAYYQRVGWTNGSSSVKQTIASLPKGKYQLTAKVRTGYANKAYSTLSLVAGGENSAVSFVAGSAGCFTTMDWSTISVDFEQQADGSLTLGFDMTWVSGGSCVMFDDIRLYKLNEEAGGTEEPTEQDVESPTEGVVSCDFVSEPQMKSDLLQMLANFSTYLKNDFQNEANNSVGETNGVFKGESTGYSNEAGVRTNADLSMICAFLSKYAKNKVTLPENVTWNDIDTMARRSLVYAYSTHKANNLKKCKDNKNWGSTSKTDYVWESSLWAMSVAYSAFFQWTDLSDTQKNYIYKLLKAECNYELGRTIPTGYSGDTKAEENGWEADILAATLGLFPNDDLAEQWYNRLREFAINSYSQKDDATDNTVIDPAYDNKTVANLYKGKNLYDDYTLQNHNYFHTSYQNVVIQELGEAALALKLFQQGLYGEEKWATNALMHNNDKVMNEVLYWLALADGELAMPNGNDWSLFLYDQITSYSTNACFLRDPRALMLENQAYKMIKARQTTTSDGSWLLRADVGARRMGVEAHRVMMTWLMHEVMSTADLTATDWNDFNRQYSDAKVFESQNVVRAASDSRFTTFSWSTGLSSYTGYIAANSVDKNKIVVPFRANNTGNILGWYEVQGKNTNATPVVSGIYDLMGNSYVMNGELNTNDATLNNRFALYSTPGNAVVYIDYVRANTNATITAEKGGLMAISVDELTKTKRTLYTADGHRQLNGSSFASMEGNWVNVDNALGIVRSGEKQFAFGDRANNNSVMTAKLYSSYSNSSRSVKANDVVDRRAITYYSNLDATSTEQLAAFNQQLTTPDGWNGVIVFDPDSTGYLLLSNFASDRPCQLENIQTPLGRPVFKGSDTNAKAGSGNFLAEENHSIVNTLKFFVTNDGLRAFQDADNPDVAYFESMLDCECEFFIKAVTTKGIVEESVKTTGSFIARIVGGDLVIETDAILPEYQKEDLTEGYQDITAEKLVNPSFEEDETYGKADGNATCDAGTFNPCYVNTVSATNSKWPNILPVKGWTAGNQLSGGSNYCRMYSMPYSTTQYCVSPKAVGNYTDRCGRPLFDEECGARTLTVLNSWDSGANAVTQSVTLPEGKYRVLMNARYICPNETSNNGKVITTSGNNTNTSLTGVKIGATTDYRYPSESGSWQQMCYDFELTGETVVTLSLGVRTSASAGAANNTLLYVDNVRLLASDGNATGIQEVSLKSAEPTTVFDLQGRRVNPSMVRRGIYIQNGKKVLY